ncbi:MAG TPA: hypothetical protein VE010_19655 [Thermoanaerobaculia bacterium]|nr:hypothetical protein [Thermoanaerobaculia bacterium]
MIRRVALTLAILYPTFISAAINVGPERSVTAPGLGLASGSQQHASMATSGEETLVAWIDLTRGRTGAYVAALSPDVELIDGSQRWLAPGAVDVAITWTGSDYLVLWTTPQGLFASTLNRDRVTVVQPRLVLSGATSISNVVWTGSTAMLIYTGESRLQAALLDREGKITKSAIAIPTDGLRGAWAGSDGTSFFVFWQRQEVNQQEVKDSILAARFTTDGTPRDATPVTVWSGGQLLEPWDVAFDGQRFAIVLSQNSSATNTVMRRILFDAATLQPTTLSPVDLGAATPPRVEWTGTRFTAYWTHLVNETPRELRTLAFSAAGADGAPVSVGGQMGRAVDSDGIWNGRALVLAWTTQDPETFETDVWATTISDNGHRNRVMVSLSHRWQALTATAARGNESMIVWIDGSAGLTQPRRLVSVHATGGVIDRAPHYYSETPSNEQPVIVFTGTMYLLAFHEILPDGNTSRIALRRIDRSGLPLDDVPIHVSYGQEFAAAWNGTHLMVAYHSGRELEAVRIAHDGTVVDSSPSRIVSGTAPHALSLASNGTDFLLAWNDGSDHPQFPAPGLLDIRGIVISTAGNAIGAPIDLATGPSNQRHPAVASDGRDYVIAYFHDQSLATKKVLREGALAGSTAQDHGTVITHIPSPLMRPAIAATASGYLVAWEISEDDVTGELWLARLNHNTAVTDTPRVVARSGAQWMLPTLTTLDDGAVDLAYGRLIDDASYGATMRVFLRRVEEGPSTGTTRRSRSVRH